MAITVQIQNSTLIDWNKLKHLRPNTQKNNKDQNSHHGHNSTDSELHTAWLKYIKTLKTKYQKETLKTKTAHQGHNSTNSELHIAWLKYIKTLKTKYQKAKDQNSPPWP